MITEEPEKTSDPTLSWKWMPIWGALLAALYLYKHHPEQLGKFGGDEIFIAIGAIILVATILEARSGVCTAGYVTIRRSKDGTGFWFAIACHGVLAGALIIVMLGDLLGMWHL